MRAEYITVAIIIAIVVGVVLYYWWVGYQQPAGQLVFSKTSIVVQPGTSTSVWLSYRPVGYAGSITVTLTTNTPYITVYPSTVTLDPGESERITITVSSGIAPGTYKVEASGGGLTAVLTVVVVGAPGAGKQASELTASELPVAWKVVSGQLVQVYQPVPNPYPYSDLVYRGLVKLGSTIKIYVYLQPKDGDYWVGDLKIEITKDVILKPDEPAYTYIAPNVYIDGKGWVEIAQLEWTPPSPTSSDWYCYMLPGTCVRQYYFKIWYYKDGQWITLYDPENIGDPGSPNTRPAIYVQP